MNHDLYILKNEKLIATLDITDTIKSNTKKILSNSTKRLQNHLIKWR